MNDKSRKLFENLADNIIAGYPEHIVPAALEDVRTKIIRLLAAGWSVSNVFSIEEKNLPASIVGVMKSERVQIWPPEQGPVEWSSLEPYEDGDIVKTSDGNIEVLVEAEGGTPAFWEFVKRNKITGQALDSLKVECFRRMERGESLTYSGTVVAGNSGVIWSADRLPIERWKPNEEEVKAGRWNAAQPTLANFFMDHEDNLTDETIESVTNVIRRHVEAGEMITVSDCGRLLYLEDEEAETRFVAMDMRPDDEVSDVPPLHEFMASMKPTEAIQGEEKFYPVELNLSGVGDIGPEVIINSIPFIRKGAVDACLITETAVGMPTQDVVIMTTDLHFDAVRVNGEEFIRKGGDLDAERFLQQDPQMTYSLRFGDPDSPEKGDVYPDIECRGFPEMERVLFNGEMYVRHHGGPTPIKLTTIAPDGIDPETRFEPPVDELETLADLLTNSLGPIIRQRIAEGFEAMNKREEFPLDGPRINLKKSMISVFDHPDPIVKLQYVAKALDEITDLGEGADRETRNKIGNLCQTIGGRLVRDD